MQKNLRYYLDFTADLHRVVDCIINENSDTAVIFLKHADKIYKNNLIQKSGSLYFPPRLRIIWNKLASTSLPKEKKARLFFADKILTLASILFIRTRHYAFN